MRELLLIGAIALAFGVGSQQMVGEFGFFNVANGLVGGACLGAAGVLWLLRLRSARVGAPRGPALDAALSAIAFLWSAILVQGFVSLADVRFDWTFERRFEIAPATTEALDRLTMRPLRFTLYHQTGDPRIRRTGLLLEEIARGRDITVRRRALDDHPEDEDRFGIGSSNSVVVEAGDRWNLVERPTQGALFEAFSRLAGEQAGVIYATVGAGEGDLDRSDDLGFTGLRAAIETEGYEVRPLPSAVVEVVPPDASAVLLISPQRRLREPAIEALGRYLEEGGSLIALLDPASESGLEALLARFGITSPDALVVDPTSGPIDGNPPGINPVAFNYAAHAITQGLDRNRMTFFRRARPLELRKVERDDRLERLVLTSSAAWLQTDPTRPLDQLAVPPPGTRGDYHTIAAAASLERGERPTRIVVFGDSGFASNGTLRALYNLDLVMNAVHWVVAREPRITLRPKGGQLLQFPVPIQNSLRAFYGVGLVVPELLLLAGGLVWLRRRAG